MTDNITEHTFTLECQSIVAEAIKEYAAYGMDRDIDCFMDEYLYQSVDGHQWVIYYHHAHEVCRNVDITLGENYIDEYGVMPKTYNEFAALIAYGEMITRCLNMSYDAIEQYQEKQDEKEAAEAS